MTSDKGTSLGRQAAIGAFVLGGASLVLAAIVLFGRSHLFNPTIQAVIVFQDSISGLAIGAPVSFRGVPIGAVESIGLEFDPRTKTAYIPVTLQIDPRRVVLSDTKKVAIFDLPDFVAKGLRAELNTQSFVTGQSEIGLDFDPESKAVLHPTITSLPEIPTRPSTVQRVKDELSQLPLQELATNANAMMKSLSNLSQKLDQSLPPLIDSVKATSDRSGDAVGIAAEAIKTMQGRLDGTLADISRLANAGTLLVNQRGTELHTVLLSSNQAVLQARDMLVDLRAFTSERGADRTNIDSALRDLAAAAAALRGFANDVEHNPQLLLTGRRP